MKDIAKLIAFSIFVIVVICLVFLATLFGGCGDNISPPDAMMRDRDAQSCFHTNGGTCPDAEVLDAEIP